MQLHSRLGHNSLRLAAVLCATFLFTPPSRGAGISDKPETPFKLATFEAQGRVRIGMVFGSRIVDIAAANDYLARKAHVRVTKLPTEMRALIEQYDAASPRLYEIANFLQGEAGTKNLPFAYDVTAVSIKAPIKYPWNLLNLAANYKMHAQGMGAAMAASGTTPGAQSPPAGGAASFHPEVASQIDPDRDGPIIFLKSARSCIIDPGVAYLIPPGRTRTDWEGELAIVIRKPAYEVRKDQAHDYVFGYSIMYDVSDRGGGRRVVSMFSGINWFDGKSLDRGAPFGPFIVPKEFLPNFNNLHVVTRVNGVAKQDGRTSELIWDEGHMIQFISSIMTLYPGDVISTGTPAGTGMERNEFLKPGDVVEIEIEGIGTLRTPMDNGRSPAGSQ
jgi:2,4-didehydro-3-deoxy-L-rhamnonate hydrolase